jgi:hypothetical protein
MMQARPLILRDSLCASAGFTVRLTCDIVICSDRAEYTILLH